ncbi:MAG: hypothetical protein ACODAC_09065 [Pseudomonadota bacterium]
MSVELLDTPRFYGYRVRRQIQGKTYQEYFSLKDGGKRLRGERRARVKGRAEARDAELARQQDNLQRKRAKQVRVDERGQVRGILCRLKAEKSGNRTPVFQIGVMSLLENRIVNTTVSINRYGVDEAWRRAVEFYAKHKQISKRSGAYRSLLEAQPSRAEVDRMVNGRSANRAGPARAGRRERSGRRKRA